MFYTINKPKSYNEIQEFWTVHKAFAWQIDLPVPIKLPNLSEWDFQDTSPKEEFQVSHLQHDLPKLDQVIQWTTHKEHSFNHKNSTWEQWTVFSLKTVLDLKSCGAINPPTPD